MRSRATVDVKSSAKDNILKPTDNLLTALH